MSDFFCDSMIGQKQGIIQTLQDLAAVLDLVANSATL